MPAGAFGSASVDPVIVQARKVENTDLPFRRGEGVFDQDRRRLSPVPNEGEGADLERIPFILQHSLHD